MSDKEIAVVCYAGHKGEERPRSFLLGDEKIEIASMTKAWIGEGAEDRRRKRFFIVRGTDGFTYTIYYDESLSAWFLKNR